MKTAIKYVAPATMIVLAGILMIGCEDSEVVVSPSGVINVTASPGVVRIDPNVDPPNPDTFRYEKETVVTATVFDDSNLPQQGVTLTFDSTSENPMDPVVADTDSNGRVSSTLLVTDLDTSPITVSARSGTVTGTVSVVVDVVGANQLPRANVQIIPIGSGQSGNVVTFDGTSSLDADSNISCYQWRITSDNPDAGTPDPLIIQGTGASGFDRTFINEQVLSVTLYVSDRLDIDCDDVNATTGGTVEPESVFSPLAFRTQYSIECNNPAPTAVIAGPDTVRATGTASTLTSVTLDGTLSSDNETRIDRYVWNCGNEFAPTNVAPDGSIVICRYRLGTYTATLNVTDQGTGVINPATGTFDCQKSSPAASVTVIISSP